MEISINGNFDEFDKLLNDMLTNAGNINKFIATKGKDALKGSNKRSFRQQRTPLGEPWEKSKLSQTDPTGSPRLTLIRSTEGYQQSQDDTNYIMKGDTLEEYNLAKSDDGDY